MKNVKGEIIKDTLEVMHAVLEGKTKLHCGAMLQIYSCGELHGEALKKTSAMEAEFLSEEQYKILKDSYNSIQAEYNKILGILKWKG